MSGIAAVKRALASVLGADASGVELEERVLTIQVAAQIQLGWEWSGGWSELPGPWSPGRGCRVSSASEASDALEGEARAIFDGQLSVLIDRPDRWQASKSQTYELSPYGVELTCGTCRGSTRIRCGSCSGDGQVTCRACHGSRHMTCQSCRGAGNNRVNRNGTYHDVNCSPCGGSGKVNCGTCGSSGRVSCGTCQASGQVPCDGCAATGAVTRVFTGQVTVTPVVELQSLEEESKLISKLLRRHPRAAGACAQLDVPGDEDGQDAARFLGNLQIHQVEIHGRAETASAAFVGDHPEAFRIEGRLDFTVRSLVDSARRASEGGRPELEQLASDRPWISQLISESMGQHAPEGLKRFADAEARRAPDRTVGAIIRELISDSVDAEARDIVGGAIRKIIRATREEQGLVASKFLILAVFATLGLGIAALIAFVRDKLFLTLDPSEIGGWKSILTIVCALIWVLAAWGLFNRRMERFHRRVAAPSEPNGARREAIRQEKAEVRGGFVLLCGLSAGYAAFMLLAPPWPLNHPTTSATTTAAADDANAEAEAAYAAATAADAASAAAAAADAASAAALAADDAAAASISSPEPVVAQGELPAPVWQSPGYRRVEGTASPYTRPSAVRPESPRETAPPAISNPIWVRQPEMEFPARAASRGIEAGEVLLNCRASPSGTVTGCSIVFESPEGAGFGGAALSGMRRATVRPKEVNGEAWDSRIQFTARFRLEP